MRLPCPTLDTKNFTAFANWVVVENMNSTSQDIIFNGFDADYVFLTIFGFDISGKPFFGSFQLLFGSTNMPVLVLGSDGQPASGVYVQANATTYPGVGQSGYTDSTGHFTFVNLPVTTIGLVARTADNQLGVNGVASTTSLVTLQLMPFDLPTNSTSFENGNGTTGWTGGSLQALAKRNLDLVVSTNFLPNLQMAHGTFKVHPFTKTAYIKYRFITEEVPGGYFGTQFNDYYSVTIRSYPTGAYATVTNSMNQLGLGAFDTSGATQWYTLALSVPAKTEYVEYNIGVSNVADSLLQSEVVVDKVADLTCDQCGDCSSCPGNPVCQDSCTNPPLHSCAFYRNCAEAAAQCGDAGYPIHYGERNCYKFTNNLAKFSTQGQTWIWDTMHCLQLALVPVLNTCPDCVSLSDAAFASHPACYVNSGFCTLPCWDYVEVLATVGMDIFESFGQVLSTGGSCLGSIRNTLGGSCVAGNLSAAAQAAQSVAVAVVKAIFDALIPPAF